MSEGVCVCVWLLGLLGMERATHSRLAFLDGGMLETGIAEERLARPAIKDPNLVLRDPRRGECGPPPRCEKNEC